VRMDNTASYNNFIFVLVVMVTLDMESHYDKRRGLRQTVARALIRGKSVDVGNVGNTSLIFAPCDLYFG